MQFKTNYRSLAIAKEKANILKRLIDNHFNLLSSSFRRLVNHKLEDKGTETVKSRLIEKIKDVYWIKQVQALTLLKENSDKLDLKEKMLEL